MYNKRSLNLLHLVLNYKSSFFKGNFFSNNKFNHKKALSEVHINNSKLLNVNNLISFLDSNINNINNYDQFNPFVYLFIYYSNDIKIMLFDHFLKHLKFEVALSSTYIYFILKISYKLLTILFLLHNFIQLLFRLKDYNNAYNRLIN